MADLRSERLRMEFFDVGAVVYLLRKVVWLVPGFTVEAYRGRLRELHERIAAEGSVRGARLAPPHRGAQARPMT